MNPLGRVFTPILAHFRGIAVIMVAFSLLTFSLLACQPVHPEASASTPVVETPEAAAPAPNSTPALVGTWTATLTSEDILRVKPDFLQEYLCDNTGTFVWKFKVDGTFAIDQSVAEGCPTPAQTHIESTWVNEDNLVFFAKGTPDEESYVWNVDGDTLTLSYQSGECIPCKAINTANPWKRVEE